MTDVRVLMVVPAAKPLREFALLMASAGATTRRPTMPAPTIPDVVAIDQSFAPVPLARTGNTARLAFASMARSPEFVVRGTVDHTQLPRLAASRDVQAFSDPEIASFPVSFNDPPVGSAADVATALKIPALHAQQLHGGDVAVAVMDGGINLAFLQQANLPCTVDAANSWAPPQVTDKPGQSPVSHGTMCAYDIAIGAPNATLLDFPVVPSRPGGTIPNLLSDALQAHAVLLRRLRAPNWPYQALVINNSWGLYSVSWDFPPGHPGRYVDNPNHPFNTVVGTLSRAGADILFAAGNCGAPSPDSRCMGVTTHTITGANAHPDVITVAGATIRNQRVGYSSQGPAIPGMKHTKPDLTCYTHFLGSRAIGPNKPDMGTSAACPVAAGCVAALRSKLRPSRLAPADLIREILADARQPQGGAGWNGDYGYGLLDAHATAKRLQLL
jgi:hypothetical protein